MTRDPCIITSASVSNEVVNVANKRSRYGASLARQDQVGTSLYSLKLILLAWGFIPPRTASRKALVALIQDVLVQFGIQEGQWVFDPEVPDTIEAVLLPMLYSRKVPKNDIYQVLQAFRHGEDAGSGKLGTYGGMVDANGAILNVNSLAAAGDTWRQNTAESMEATARGDFDEGWTQFVQGWDDFWSGNF